MCFCVFAISGSKEDSDHIIFYMIRVSAWTGAQVLYVAKIRLFNVSSVHTELEAT